MKRVLALLLMSTAVAAADEQALIEAMRSPDAATRSRAFEQIKSLPPDSRVAALRRVLREFESEGYVDLACQELGLLGPAAVPALPELIRTLYSASWRSRHAAVAALGVMGVSALRARGILEELAEERSPLSTSVNRTLTLIDQPDQPVPDPLADEPWRVEGRRMASGAAPITDLQIALEHDHPYVRHHACSALQQLGYEGLVVLGAKLGTSQGSPRLRALQALASSGDPRATPYLLDVLRSDEGPSLEIAIGALGNLKAPEAEEGIRKVLLAGNRSQAAVAIAALDRIRAGASEPVLRAWFESPDERLNDLAYRMILYSPERAGWFIPELIQALYTPRRNRALNMLGRLGPAASSAGPFLIDLRDREGKPNGKAIFGASIRATGGEAPLADPFPEPVSRGELIEALRGDDWLKAGMAARRLGRVKWGPEVNRALANALHHPKPFVVAAYFDAIKLRGAEAVPALAEALDSGSIALRRRILEVLTEMGRASADAADAVIRCLDVVEIRPAAVEWIKKVGPPAAAAVPKLVALYRESEQYPGDYGVALACIGEAGKEILPDLIRDAEDSERCWSAVYALRQFGPLGASAAPTLGRLVRERHEEVPNPRASHVVLQAIDALAREGDAGADEIRAFLRSGNDDLARLVTEVLRYAALETPALNRVYWDVRESRSEIVRGAAMGYLRRPTVLAQLEDEQLRVLFEMESDTPHSQWVAGAMMKRADVAGLIKGLQSENGYLRRAALNFLKQRKDEAAPALPALAKVLSEESNVRQMEALLQLICDIAGKGAQPYVVEFVRQGEGSRKFDLGFRRLKGWGDIPYLCGLLSDKDKRVRTLAAKTLNELRPRPNQALRDALSANLLDPELRTSFTASILSAWGAESAPLFVELLRSLKDSEYRVAVPHLEKMGAEALPALRVALADKHPSVRSRTVYLMEKCGSVADDDLLKTLRGDRHEDVREATVRALTRRGAKAAPLILPALEDPHRDVRNRAWYFVRENPKTIESAVPLLIRSLSKSEWRKETIERLKFARDTALPLLEAAAKSGQDSDAVLALAELGVAEEKTLRALLASDDEEAQLRAVRLLAQLGLSAEASVPSLLALLHSPRRETAEEAVRTLGCLGPAARPAVDRILAVRHGGRSPLKDAVAVALTRIEHPPLVLVDLLKAGNSGLNDEVWRALRQGKIASLPELMALAECKDTDIARKAIPLIGELGPVAKAAIPVLKRVAANRNIGGYANAALAKIQPK